MSHTWAWALKRSSFGQSDCNRTRTMSPLDTATIIQAARINAVDLLETAKLLRNEERYPHSFVFGVLALEEAGKVEMALALLLGLGPAPNELWRSYRQHTAKTSLTNFAIVMRAGVLIPDLSTEVLERLRNGPSPKTSMRTSSSRYTAIASSPAGARGSCASQSRLERTLRTRPRRCECIGELPARLSAGRTRGLGKVRLSSRETRAWGFRT